MIKGLKLKSQIMLWLGSAGVVLAIGVIYFPREYGDESIWERKPMETLAANKQMMAYAHDGFWQCMDTLRDKQLLERLWDSGEAPWRVW